MNHTRFLDCAFSVALCSPGVGQQRNFRLGAVLVDKKRIIASGYNSMITHPKTLRWYKYPYLHAEAAVIFKRGLDYCEGSRLYLCRIKRDESRALAKPCESCMALMESVGIKSVIYTLNEEEWEDLIP